MNNDVSLLRVLRDQRRPAILAVVLAAAAFWTFLPMGEWRIAVFVAAGLLVGLLNHIATEVSLLRMIESGEELTKGQVVRSAFARLMVISAVGVVLAVVFWPDGLTALIGLALYRLMTLVMTSIPLIKELRKA